MLTYNQNGTSRGIASIIFNKPDTALKAAKELNGLHVDGRPMKVRMTVAPWRLWMYAKVSNRSKSSSMLPTPHPFPLPSLWPSVLCKSFLCYFSESSMLIP
jgi:RNA recognition motif-containing protein